MGDRGAGDTHMHLACARLAHHLHDLHRRGSANHAVVDQHDPLAFDLPLIGAVFQLHAELANALFRLDEGAADIVVANDAELERRSDFLRIADCRRHPGIRNGNDDVGVGRRLARQLPPHLFPHVIDAAPFDDGIGPGKIDVFEDA